MRAEYATEARRGQPACGSGWDAVCHTVMRKGSDTVALHFSGTNPGRPLIGIAWLRGAGRATTP